MKALEFPQFRLKNSLKINFERESSKPVNL